MKIDIIYVIEGNKFGKSITEWAEEEHITVEEKSHRDSELRELVKGVVLFHENHNFSKDDLELFNALNNANIPAHRVDIDGTLSATRSNFLMWFENNQPTTILFLGNDKIANNAHLKKFIGELK